MIRCFADGLQQYLLDRLDIGNPEAVLRLDELIAEDEAVARERARLQDTRRKLEDIQSRLDAYIA